MSKKEVKVGKKSVVADCSDAQQVSQILNGPALMPFDQRVCGTTRPERISDEMSENAWIERLFGELD
jgi:hypothetical protein